MPDLADIVIVGGGLLGTALAFSLAQRNLRVVLLEAHRLAYGATGGGFAWVNATYKDFAHDAPYFRLNAEGMIYYDQLAEEWGADRIGVYSGGALFWAQPEDTVRQNGIMERARQLQAAGYPVSLLSPAELAALEPHVAPLAPLVLGGRDDNKILFAPADKWIDTPRLCRFFVEQAQARRAEIRLNCPATGFTRSVTNAISTVETPQGRIATRMLVLAAGLETPPLAALASGDSSSLHRVPVRCEPGLLVETPPLPRPYRCNRILYPPDTIHRGGLHLRPTPLGGLLIGAEDIDAGLLRTNPASLSDVPEAQVGALLDHAAMQFPGLPPAALHHGALPRLCARPVPRDGLPIVGSLPGVSGVYVAVTHSGVTLGPLLAHLLTEEIITGSDVPSLNRYRPTRFKE